MAITVYTHDNPAPGERAAKTGVYTLPNGARIQVRAGGLIPEGAVRDADRIVADEPEQRAKPKPENRAKKAAPENR